MTDAGVLGCERRAQALRDAGQRLDVLKGVDLRSGRARRLQS